MRFTVPTEGGAFRINIMNIARHKQLFEASSEKGASEWIAFNAVRGDRVDAYKVSAMPKPLARKIVRFGTGRLLILKQA